MPSAHATPAAAPVVVEEESEEEVDLEPMAGSPVKRAAVVVPPGPVLGVQKRYVARWQAVALWHCVQRLTRSLPGESKIFGLVA